MDMIVKNIKEYFQQKKEESRQATPYRIKLGIIDATEQGDSANQLYIKNKCKDFLDMGWDCQVYTVKENTGSAQDTINFAIADGCTSVIVQLPTREGIEFSPDMIPPAYDCDGLNPCSLVVPATPAGIIEYLKDCDFTFSGKHAVVLGRSDIVGKPMARELTKLDMTVSLLHSKTRYYNRELLLDNSDLVICATGHPHTISRIDCPYAFVVDVGINRNEDGKLCGDFDEADGITDKCTPVPGGVGLLTRLALMQNCYTLAKLQQEEKEMDGQMKIAGFEV
jgi:methylenetetrahydrofolate dehydrogenase (NADP+)/methenyltetrahydrofolate cyclohydrolase